MTHYKNNIFNLVDIAEVGLYDDLEFIKKIVPGSKIWLLREPKNPKDKNAISVHLNDVIGKIGYIPKQQAKKLAPIIAGVHNMIVVSIKNMAIEKNLK